MGLSPGCCTAPGTITATPTEVAPCLQGCRLAAHSLSLLFSLLQIRTKQNSPDLPVTHINAQTISKLPNSLVKSQPVTRSAAISILSAHLVILFLCSHAPEGEQKHPGTFDASYVHLSFFSQLNSLSPPPHLISVSVGPQLF